MTFSNSLPRPQSSEPSPHPRGLARASRGRSRSCPKRGRGSSDISGRPYSGVAAFEAPPLACTPSARNAGAKLLGSDLTRRKHNTSQFLIDNFGACLTRRPPRADESPLVPPKRFSTEAGPTSKLEPPTSSPNRHTPRLESPVSHRKQTIGPHPNRHKFAFCERAAFTLPAPSQIPSLPAGAGVAEGSSAPASMELTGSRPYSRLSTVNCRLPLLIANEIQTLRAAKPAKPPRNRVPDSVDSREAHTTLAHCKIPHHGGVSSVR
jgi:hypothetical protein